MARSAFAVVYDVDRSERSQSSDVVERAAAALTVLNGASPSRRRTGATSAPASVVLAREPVLPLVHRAATVGPDQSLAATADAHGIVRADAVGFAHCCWGTAGDVVVVSDSALVVAAALRAGLDPAAVAMLSLVGFLVDGTTLHRGVRRLQGGDVLDVSSGRLRPAPDPRGKSERAGGPSNRGGAAVLGNLVASLLREHPDPVLELSGGLDSRAVLAAIPADARRGLRAVTLGRPDDADVRVARRLAATSGLDWHTVDPAALLSLPNRDLTLATLRAARRRDLTGSALSAVILDHAEANIPSGPRFTGANGEFARGFYYPGFLTDGPVGRARVERLVSWRLVANDGPAAHALSPEIVAEARSELVDVVERLLTDNVSWRAATDEFYLATRMSNWAGPGYSTRDEASPALAPFLHPDFLAWARGLPLRRRARERAFASMVCDLDPSVADEPLDRGVSVTDLAAGGTVSMARHATATAAKVVRKVDQRLRTTGRSPALTDELATAVQAGWGPDESGALEDSGLFRPSFVSRLATGDPVDGPSLSLAANVVAARGFFDEVASLDGATAGEGRDVGS